MNHGCCNSKNVVNDSVLLLWLSSCLAGIAKADPLDFDGSKWIWYSPGAEVPLGQLPAAANYMRSTLDVPDGAKVEAAEVIATCDNLFVLYLNGKPVGESGANNNAWGQPRRWCRNRLDRSRPQLGGREGS